MASRKIFRHFLHANFFMFILLISNRTVFLVQFATNLHLWVFQKAESALAEAARAISAFWKTRSCKLIPNWTRNRMITYTKFFSLTLNLVNSELHTFSSKCQSLQSTEPLKEVLSRITFGTTSASRGDQSFPQHSYSGIVQVHNFSALLHDLNFTSF